MLWGHNCEMERCLIVQPDSCGDILPRLREKAVRTWGTAWPNVIPDNADHDIPLLLWSNSTLRLMMFWYKGTRQQPGRSRLSISRHPELLVLDVRVLTEQQIKECHEIFHAFKDRTFLPANEAYRDSTRKYLDAELFRMLDLDSSLIEELDLLRRKWCAEPSVHGGKSTRIATNL